MAKVTKLEVYIVDYADEYQDAEHFIGELKELIRDQMWVQVSIGEIKESEVFEWNDDLKINRTDSTIEDLEAYFTRKGE